MKSFSTAFFVMAATLAVAATPGFAQNGPQAPNAPVSSRPRAVPAVPSPQPAPPGQAPVVVYQNPADAREVQQQLRELMRAYPPSLLQILRLDPSLMQREDYMAAYPALIAGARLYMEPVDRSGSDIEASVQELYRPTSGPSD